MAAEWYYESDGKEQGPFTAVELRELATAGKLQAGYLIWKTGMQRRVPARSVKGLFDTAAPTTETASRQTALAKTPVPKPAKKAEELVEPEAVEEVVEVEAAEHEEVVETVEAVDDKPATKKPTKAAKDRDEDKDRGDEPPPEMIAEAAAIYREGIPDLDGPIGGTLYLESTGLRFSFENEEEEADEVRLPFAKIDSVLEPAKGDFPPEMKKKAMKAKVAGKAGKLAAGMVGGWLGGSAGNATEKLGKGAANMAEQAGNLGKPPRNRLTVLATIRKERAKIYLDVSGQTSEEMTEEAKILYKKIQKARDKWSNKDSAKEPGDINIVVNQTAVGVGISGVGAGGRGGGAGALPTAAGPSAKAFRVLSGGSLLGPLTLDELRGLMAAGKLGAGDMIGVETWLPVATLSGLLGGKAAAAGARAQGIAHDEDEESDDEDEDAPETDVDEVENEPASPAASEGDSIPVDEEFKFD
jgi:hypothetical protein